MTSKNDVCIIGGGVNGLCTAYYLSKSGYQVEVIDPAFSREGTSYGNAGMVVPSHFIPMASPGIISKGIKWMFNSSSPFYIKPRLDPRLIHWLWRFNRSCNERNVKQNSEVILNYNELSKNEYRSIAKEEELEFDFQEKGLLMLFKNAKSKKEEVEIAEQAHTLGVEARLLGEKEVQELNPYTKVEVLGGVYYPGDAHLYSNRFMQQIEKLLRSRGVKFTQAMVNNAKSDKHSISELHLSNGETRNPEQVVLTAGAWSWKLLKKLGINLLLEDGKGYSITIENIDLKPSIPSILTEEKVAITPMEDHLRITGTLEISGLSPRINHKRVKGFLDAVPDYFPDVQVPSKLVQENIWTGYRPLSFDGVPYVGRSKKISNLVVATGHGMMGMSLGPGTGKLVNQLITGERTSIDIESMRLER